MSRWIRSRGRRFGTIGIAVILCFSLAAGIAYAYYGPGADSPDRDAYAAEDAEVSPLYAESLKDTVARMERTPAAGRPQTAMKAQRLTRAAEKGTAGDSGYRPATWVTCSYSCMGTCLTCLATCTDPTCFGTCTDPGCDYYTFDSNCQSPTSDTTCEGATCGQATCSGDTCQSTCEGDTCSTTCGGETCDVTCGGTTCGANTGMWEIAGADRYATAVAASQSGWPEGLDPDGSATVVIATGENWPDALGGASLAGALGGPILLTKGGALPGDTASEITRLGAAEAIILGGTGAVGAGVEGELKNMLGSGNVTRIAGANRYATARAIAAEVVALQGEYWDGMAFVATGGNFPDALGVSPLAAWGWWPIYLVDPGAGADSALISAMSGNTVTKVYILGGTGAVSSGSENAITSGVGASVERLAGSDRYDTACTIAEWGVQNCVTESGTYDMRWDGVAVATGENFPDALAGGVLQGWTNSVMLLTPRLDLYQRVGDTIQGNNGDIEDIYFLGGTGAVSAGVRLSIQNLLL